VLVEFTMMSDWFDDGGIPASPKLPEYFRQANSQRFVPAHRYEATVPSFDDVH
jgi:hypothetical protein